ncbi:MAG: hypothetical protein GY737_12665 [Desulfobacteraceae bacterium]|nr:hypothetical protein [Desulfobacteraceae bacterium]
MPNHESHKKAPSITELTPEICVFLNDVRDKLKGAERRHFMASFVKLLGYGGQLKAERLLCWDRKTILKGTRELESGITCVDNFSSRGRKSSESHLPNLLEDIKKIVTPISQTDPTLRSTHLYSPITAAEVRRRLISEMNYNDKDLPTTRTISNKMNQLGFKLKKVQICKPKIKGSTDSVK